MSALQIITQMITAGDLILRPPLTFAEWRGVIDTSVFKIKLFLILSPCRMVVTRGESVWRDLEGRMNDVHTYNFKFTHLWTHLFGRNWKYVFMRFWQKKKKKLRMIIHLLTCCVINKPVFSFGTVNHVRPLLFMTLWCWFWLHSLRNALKYVRYSCQKCLQAADEINFPRYQEAVPPHVLHKSLWTAGAARLLQPHPLVKTLKRLLVIPHVREGVTFSHWQSRHISRCPLPPSSPVVCSAEMGQSSRGLMDIHGGAGSRVFFFSDSCVGFCGTVIASGDWWITLLHTFTQEIEAWKMIFEASRQVDTFACFHSRQC